MLTRLGIAAGLMLVGSVIIDPNKAEAVVYEFSNYSPGANYTGSGFFDIDDANSDNLVNFSTELIDVGITINDGTNEYNLSFSDIVENSLNNIPINGSILDFSVDTGTSGIFRMKSSASNEGFFAVNKNADRGRVGLSNSNYDQEIDVTLTATAVPFEFSPTIGLGIVGGIMMIYRLRKNTIAARKLEDKSSV